MSRTIALIYILVICTVASYCNESKTKQMKIGYTQGDLCLSLGTEVRLISKGAIQFPEAYLTRLKGSRIVKVRIGIGDSLTEQENSIFITNKLDGKPLYTQAVSQLNSGWNDVVLETPLEITGEELFIGYRYVTRGSTVSFDAGENNDFANWISCGTSEESLTWYHQQDCGSLNIQALIEGDDLPQNDAAIYSVTSKKYAQSDHRYPVEFLVRNMAAADIKSLDITYTFEGLEPVSRTINDLCIKSNDIELVCLDDASIPEAGIYDLHLKIDEVNGNDDESDSDNQKTINNIVCKDEYTRRKVLLEQFSTAKCNNCPHSHVLLEKNLKYRKGDVIWLIHHSGFYTDDLTIDESKSYVYFYNSTSGYAPAAMLDRTNLAPFGALNADYQSTSGPVFNTVSNLIPKLLDQRVNTPALITVNPETEFDPVDRLLTVSVSGELPGGNADRLKGNDIRLNIYLVEDSIPGIQSGIEGTYIHNHVIRKVLSEIWGDKIAFNNEKYSSREYTFTVPEEWKEKKTRIIAFVANSDSKNPNNAQIYNAEEVELMPKQGDTSIKPEKDCSDIEIYQNTEELCIKGNYKSAVIYNSTGNSVRSISKPEKNLSIVTFEKGFYFIKFDSDQNSVVKKFLIR